MSGDVRDQVEVLVWVKHCQPGQFGDCCDEQVRHGRASMVSTVGLHPLHFNGSGLLSVSPTGLLGL
jgi:hypothetical protein